MSVTDTPAASAGDVVSIVAIKGKATLVIPSAKFVKAVKITSTLVFFILELSVVFASAIILIMPIFLYFFREQKGVPLHLILPPCKLKLIVKVWRRKQEF
ncbi:hypothetical protein AO263_19125 [Pseudomonas sp. NZIPFR-PS5]|nr:hypothetical protein AO263_19125 [Pseudomonas sp. NZIPFR-PS5]